MFLYMCVEEVTRFWVRLKWILSRRTQGFKGYEAASVAVLWLYSTPAAGVKGKTIHCSLCENEDLKVLFSYYIIIIIYCIIHFM